MLMRRMLGGTWTSWGCLQCAGCPRPGDGSLAWICTWGRLDPLQGMHARLTSVQAVPCDTAAVLPIGPAHDQNTFLAGLADEGVLPRALLGRPPLLDSERPTTLESERWVLGEKRHCPAPRSWPMNVCPPWPMNMCPSSTGSTAPKAQCLSQVKVVAPCCKTGSRRNCLAPATYSPNKFNIELYNWCPGGAEGNAASAIANIKNTNQTHAV